MRNNIKKTTHFLKRAWERGFDQFNLDKITTQMQSQKKSKTYYVYSKKYLQKMKINLNNNFLIIVVKEDVLVTLFQVEDIYAYFNSTNLKQSEIQLIS